MPSLTGAQLYGHIPSSLTRAQKLETFVAQRQKLQGDIPAFGSTVQHLALYENTMKRLRHSCYTNDSYVLLQYNTLSCHLPFTLGNNASPRMTLCSIGNQLQEPSPPWVSRFERNGLFWSSGKEGQALLARVASAVVVFVVALLSQLGWRKILFAITRLQQDVGRPSLLNLCASQLPNLAYRGLLCVALLMVLMDWAYYDCPGTLTLASSCHKGSTHIHLLVVLLWGQLVTSWRLSLTGPNSLATSAKTQVRSCALWPLIIWPLSLLAMLNMASMCVPGFLGLGIGTCQSLISMFVIPYLAEKLTPDKYLFTNAATILTSVCFPMLCIMYFDHDCLGRWTAWWGPCSLRKRQNFAVLVEYTLFGLPPQAYMALKTMEVCSPRHGQSCSICVMAIALKMQSMLMAKTITTSLLMPLRKIRRISTGTYSKNFAMSATVKVGGALQMIMLLSGILPLFMPILWVAWVCETLVIAIAQKEGSPEGRNLDALLQQMASMGVVLSAMLHIAFASGSSLASMLQVFLTLWLLRVQSMPGLSKTEQ